MAGIDRLAVRANDASCTRRPRVAVVMGPVPPDVGHLDRLAREFDVLAYFGKGDPPKAHPVLAPLIGVEWIGS